MSPVVNFAAAKDSGFEPLPAGEYKAKLVSHRNENGKESGQPYVVLEFQMPDNNNRRQWQNCSLQPQSLWRLRKTLSDLGCSLEILNSEAFDTDTAIESVYEAECILVLEVDSSYNPEKPKNNIKDTKPLNALAKSGNSKK